MKVVVTGANGFIGRRVVAAAREQGHSVVAMTRDTPEPELDHALQHSDAVFHLAGINRSPNAADFDAVNVALTARVAACLDVSRQPIVVYSSSTQAGNGTHYGRTKQQAEETLAALGERGARVAIFRLPNVFGPGARPNYNSVVATFAHGAATGQPLEVHDASRELTLVYVHDVARAMVGVLEQPPLAGTEFRSAAPQYAVTVGKLAELFAQYGRSRDSQLVPDVSSELTRRLYATYLACLPEQQLGYALPRREDQRGVLAEFLKSPASGQLFVSRTRPGVTRGNHFHHTKTEKFLVLEGDAVIRFRRVSGDPRVVEYRVSGRDLRVVDIPPDWTHSIENAGAGELIVLFWACEIFDPSTPDTHPLDVLR